MKESVVLVGNKLVIAFSNLKKIFFFFFFFFFFLGMTSDRSATSEG